MMKKVSNNLYSMGKGIENFFNTFPIYLRKISLFLIISLYISFFPIKVLLATDFKTGTYIKSWKASNGGSFTIEYTHSVQLTQVTESYVIKENKIILMESYFQSYGAGLPATTPYKFEITEKGFRIYDINQVMEDLIYRTGAERANHKLIIKNKEYVFLDFTEPRSAVEFNVKRIGFLHYLVREVLK